MLDYKLVCSVVCCTLLCFIISCFGRGKNKPQKPRSILNWWCYTAFCKPVMWLIRDNGIAYWKRRWNCNWCFLFYLEVCIKHALRKHSWNCSFLQFWAGEEHATGDAVHYFINFSHSCILFLIEENLFFFHSKRLPSMKVEQASPFSISLYFYYFFIN